MSEAPEQDVFFNTEVPFSRKKRHSADHFSFNAALKLKQAKDQARKLERVYTRALTKKTQRQKSISELQKNAQKIRVDFLKLYENKKIKLLNKQKVQNFLVESKQHLNSVHRKTRQRKLLDEYQMLTTKNEEHQNNQLRQQKNKKDKDKLLKQIRVKNLEVFIFAKQQYSKIKDERNVVTERNKKIEEILEMRSHINYAEKIQKQLALIGHYEDLLKQIQQDEEISDMIRPATSASKNFFITSRKMHSSKESRGVHTSHTAR